MAISTSFSKFFSFLSPQTKPQPQPLLSQFPSHHNNHRNRIIPLVLTRNETSSSVTTSLPDDMSSDFASLTSSSTMFISTKFNVEVVMEDDEPEERLLGRFRREVMRAGIIQECKRRKFYENPQDEKKRRVRDAAKRNRRNKFPRRTLDGKPLGGGRYDSYRQDDPKPVKEEDSDNWDIAEDDAIQF